MRIPELMAIAITVVLLVPVGAQAQEPSLSEPSASLPLNEVLRLYRENEKAKEVVTVEPPIEASVDSIEFKGLLLDRSIEVTASVVASVLADDQWVVIPLIRNARSLNLVGLPSVESGTLTIIDGDLVLVMRKRGTHRFELRFSQLAEVDGRQRAITIEVADATSALLRLGFDASSFQLLSRTQSFSGDEAVLFPSSNTFLVEWERHSDLVQEAVSEPREAPPIDPVITRAHASVVSTLEGERILRFLYEFRMHGRHDLRCLIGEQQILRRVILNGSAVPFEVEDGWLVVDVMPTLSGGDSGTLELVVSGEPSTYHLAGDLEFAFPTLSWPVHELFASLHLPDVFNYSWKSGSLEPIAGAPSSDFSTVMPVPGKELSFHQFLVSDSVPRLTLAYTVDLEGRYFRP